MKKYFVQYGSFANQYKLRYTEDGSNPPCYERISRDEALYLCRAENRRRKYDRAFAGYADNTILPFPLDGSYLDDYTLNGCIWEKKRK